jgi:hypothetical protein
MNTSCELGVCAGAGAGAVASAPRHVAVPSKYAGRDVVKVRLVHDDPKKSRWLRAFFLRSGQAELALPSVDSNAATSFRSRNEARRTAVNLRKRDSSLDLFRIELRQLYTDGSLRVVR